MEGFYEYHVVMEKEVFSDEDLSCACMEAFTIAKELELAWIYAAARPFHFVRLQLQLQTIEGPSGWSGNYQAVEQSIRQESQARLTGELKVSTRNWEIPPFLPLETALRARSAYLAANPTLRDLIDLHAETFRQFGQPRYLLLAKALEIARAFYSDSVGITGRQARNSGLQTLVEEAGTDGKLTQTVEWLFEIANKRREIRHAWHDEAKDLHPRLTRQEEDEFVRNADLVVRVFICSQLSLPVVVGYEGPL